MRQYRTTAVSSALVEALVLVTVAAYFGLCTFAIFWS